MIICVFPGRQGYSCGAEGRGVSARVADDGSGLPKKVRKYFGLFWNDSFFIMFLFSGWQRLLRNWRTF